ncbi:hypothetical protein H8E07_03700 [bacterium]|nr:hypothetical protein [bacterium]
MDGDITTLLRLTHEMAEALEREDLDACTALIGERGRRLADLRVRLGDTPPAEDLRLALAEIQERDRALAEKLSDAMALIGRQMGDLRARKTRQIPGGDVPTYINRRA